MYGCMSMSTDGAVVMIVIVNPTKPTELLVCVTVEGVAIDPIPLNLGDLRKMLEVIDNGR